MMEKKGKQQQGDISSSPGTIPGKLIADILNSLEGVVYVSDLTTDEILFANTYLKKCLGFDPTGRNCRQLIHPSHGGDGDGGDFCDNRKLFDANGRPAAALHHEFQNPFNKKWYAAKAQAIEWTQGRYVRLETALDITEHKRLRSFLTEARLQAENAISTKNRFVALVAHDLKSPFLSILGMLRRILKKERFEHEVHRKFLENIITNGQRMLKMIDNLLDMDRLETGRIKPEPSFFDLSRMVGEVFENFTHLAERKNLILTNKVPVETEIYADKYLYFVVLNNLISNAVKFSFAQGRIEVSYDADGERARLIVRDEGQGIPAKYIDDIFKPDVKTTSIGTGGETGSGLGLVFCQQILKAHGGMIRLESVEGSGTTFYVELGPSCRLPLVDSGCTDPNAADE